VDGGPSRGGTGEAEMIDRLLGQSEWLYMEWSLLKQKYLLATEELDLLRAQADWLDQLLRAAADDPALDPERLAIAVVIGGDGIFSVGEVTVLDSETLREPFGAGREACPGCVELFGHDVPAAEARSCELTVEGNAIGGQIAEGEPPPLTKSRLWARLRRRLRLPGS